MAFKREENDDNSNVSVSEEDNSGLTWRDCYRRTLPSGQGEESPGSEVKVSVSAGRDSSGSIKCVVSHLRRYKKGKPTKQGVVLKTADLETIWERNKDEKALNSWTHNIQDRKINVSFMGLTLTTIAVTKGSQARIITLGYHTFRQFVETIQTLRFVVGALCSDYKIPYAESSLMAIITKNLTDTTEGDESKAYCLMKDVYQASKDDIEILEKTLKIPHATMQSLIERKDLVPLFLNHLKEEITDVTERNRMLRLVVDNEVY